MYPSKRFLEIILAGFIPYSLSFFVGSLPFLIYVAFIIVIILYDISRGFKREKIEVERDVPHNLYFRREVQVCIKIRNYHPFPIRVEVRDLPPEAFYVSNAGAFLKIFAYGEGEFRYSVTPNARGEHIFKGVYLLISIPPFVTIRRVVLPLKSRCEVLPELGLIRYFRKREGLNILRRRYHRFIPRLIPGIDISGVRDYIQGDEMRQISWKHTARRSKPMVRVYEPAREENTILVIDSGRLSRSQLDGFPVFEYLIEVAIKLSFFKVLKGGRIGLLLFSRGIKGFSPPQRGWRGVKSIIGSLRNIEPGSEESDYDEVASFLMKRVKRRSMVILFGRIPKRPASFLDFVSKVARRHIIIVATVCKEGARRDAFVTPSSTDGIYRSASVLNYLRELDRVKGEVFARGGIFFYAPPSTLLPMLLNNIP